jgi:uncharacterized protein (DUF4415 family)
MSENDTKRHTKTNLGRIDKMNDDEIDTSEIPPLGDKFFETAKWRHPSGSIRVTVQVEPEILEWFQAQGENYERDLSAALRLYVYAHQKSE